MKTDQKNIRWLHTEISEWLREGVITEGTATSLRMRYGPPVPERRLGFIIFGILGSLLITSGIILLFAYNWETLGRPIRAVLALSPLLIVQALGAWVLLRRQDSHAWREGVATGTMLTLAAAIGLIGQTYHVEGDLGGFLLTWGLLSLPLLFVYQSGMAFTLYQLIIVSWAANERIDGQYPQVYWLLLAPSLYLIWELYHLKNRERTLRALRWCLVVTLSVALGFTLEYSLPGLWLILYSGWFSFLFMLQTSDTATPDDTRTQKHPFRTIGGLGIAALAMVLTFSFGWKELIHVQHWTWQPDSWKDWLDILMGMLILGAAGVLWSQHLRERRWAVLLWGSAFLVFTAGYMVTVMTGTLGAVLLANAYLFVLALATMRNGLNHAELGTVNKGLILLSALILMRFFDNNMGLMGRGIAFILVGAGFLTVNLILSRRFKKEAL
ncbi:MAG: DUF2157 domain-containing protein [Verrucomicrobiota bacterium]|nr:DUF2157 domain-containing protein [Verrucomicrobiota bacterium]